MTGHTTQWHTSRYVLTVRHGGRDYFFRRDAKWSSHMNKALQFRLSEDAFSAIPAARRTLGRHEKTLKVGVTLFRAGTAKDRKTIPVIRGHKKGVRKNPSGDAVTQADDLLYSFSGARATKEIRVSAKPIRVGLAVGQLSGVMYEADRGDGPHQYFHKFKKSSRPLLIADNDGSQLGIVGGRFRFTDRGIVDE